MSYHKIAKEWLIAHEHYEHDPSFAKDLADLTSLLEEASANFYFGEEKYDSQFGDNKECLCGDPYYRHFDTYDNMAPVGCKYCTSYTYHSNGVEHGNGVCTGFKLKE